MKEGLGEIKIEFVADLPPGGPNRRLTLENHHQERIAAYQVNCLVPRDPEIRTVAQKRNYSQSAYQLDFVQAGSAVSADRAGMATAGLLLLTRAVWIWRKRRHPWAVVSCPLR